MTSPGAGSARRTAEPARACTAAETRIARVRIMDAAVTAPRAAPGSALPRWDAATIAADDWHLIQAADQPSITGIGIIPPAVTRTAFPGATRGLTRNANPGVFAGPGTDEPRIAGVVQRATGAASWVAV